MFDYSEALGCDRGSQIREWIQDTAVAFGDGKDTKDDKDTHAI